MTDARRIALAGIGKIARDQHIPSLEASSDWTLAATISRSDGVDGIPHWTDIETFLNDEPQIDTVSLCMPPVPRFSYARKALQAGRHVMLEKPPGATLAEVHALEALARSQGVTLFATWHSRMAAGVAVARDWLADKQVTRAHIDWKEDVRRWHPGQDWVFDPGGMGVFDPGINAFSILTEILPEPVFVTEATLEVPGNRQTPIAAEISFSGGVSATLDWRQEGPQSWNIDVETDAGAVALRDGGARVEIAGEDRTPDDALGEYPALYARMADLVSQGQSDVDLTPMVLVADALSLGERRQVADFHF